MPNRLSRPFRAPSLTLAAGLALGSGLMGSFSLPTALAQHQAAATSAAQPTSPATPIAIPDTPAGRTATAFIAMINSTTDEAIREFETTHRSSKRLAETPIPERIERIHGLRSEWGTLTVTAARPTSDGSVELTVLTAKGQSLDLSFEFDPQEPGKLSGVIIAGPGERVTSQPLTSAQRSESVNAAATALENGYVFPDMGRKMADMLRAKLAAGEYDSLADTAALVRRLTGDLQAMSNDKHLGIRQVPPAPPASPTATPSPAAAPMSHDDDERMARENYAFRKVERLDGNIGYIAFDLFVQSPRAEAKAAAAMEFVADCDAIIFDLRRNGGGTPEMIRFITSYLFTQKTHLNDMIDRDGKTVEEFWTNEEVPGRRPRENVPVYILTSPRTFSGAEEFAYNLKNLKRATIIGQTTGGGAHPVRGERIGDNLMIRVPFMRACNPISKTNWEGKGVEPDITTPTDDALDRALEEIHKQSR